MRTLVAIVSTFVIAGGIILFVVAPPRTDSKMNAVTPLADYDVSAAAQALHNQLRVADLHADTLLWARDPSRRQNRGQTDLPRLTEGGVRLQIFGAVTKSPRGQNYEENDADSDQLTMLMVAQRWPMRTWRSIFERATHQSRRLEKLQAAAPEKFQFVKTQRDLDAALASGRLAGVMATEGAHPLEGDIDNLLKLYDAGYRVLGLQHFFDNALGGSLHGTSGAGLTQFGRNVIADAVAREMIIDVAHSSEAVVRDVLSMIDRPVIVSHTGLKGHCDSPRNISDALMVDIAAAGGLIGVGFWDGAVCDPSPQSIAAAIVYAIGLLGADHVALGSDFDGAVTTAFDASQLALVTQALLEAQVDEETIRLVMGENAIRFFLGNLPA